MSSLGKFPGSIGRYFLLVNRDNATTTTSSSSATCAILFTARKDREVIPGVINSRVAPAGKILWRTVGGERNDG